MRGIDKVRLIAVWDGKNETAKDLDARLVKHMVDLMRDTGGMVEHINPFKLSGSVENAITEETPPNFNEAEKKPKPKRKTDAHMLFFSSSASEDNHDRCAVVFATTFFHSFLYKTTTDCAYRQPFLQSASS